MLDFIVDCDTDWNETCDILKTYRRFHCLATYYASKKKWEDAFHMWDRLIKKDVEDVHFPGYAYVAEQLTKYGYQTFKLKFCVIRKSISFFRSEDISLIWRFSGDILKKDEAIGAKIFTSEKFASIKPRVVIDYLRSYPLSLRTYLEFLISEKRDDDESVHSQLAMMYIDDIKASAANSNSPKHRMTVNKLRSLLRSSKKLELTKLYNILDTSCFPHEHAIVCGRLGHHSTAINTFINNLKVFYFMNKSNR